MPLSEYFNDDLKSYGMQIAEVTSVEFYLVKTSLSNDNSRPGKAQSKILYNPIIINIIKT